MPSVKVYRNSTLLDTLVFHKQFMILELAKALHWHADEELAVAAKGTIRVWVRREADTYKIVYVLPTWRLSVDNLLYESQLYEDIEIGHRLIKLDYSNYSFEFAQ